MEGRTINSFRINDCIGRGGAISTPDPLRPRRGYGQFFQLPKSIRINEARRKHLQCANWPVDDFVAAQNLTQPPASTTDLLAAGAPSPGVGETCQFIDSF